MSPPSDWKFPKCRGNVSPIRLEILQYGGLVSPMGLEILNMGGGALFPLSDWKSWIIGLGLSNQAGDPRSWMGACLTHQTGNS